MKYLSITFLVILSAVLYHSCKEKDNNNNNNSDNTPSKSKAELLTQKRWKVSSINASGTEVWNSFLVPACNMDNTYEFKTTNILTGFDVPNKCNSTDPDSTNSPYALISNNTKIYLNAKLSSTITIDDTTDIVQLDENTLKLSIEYSSIPAVLTFVHP